MSKEGRGRGSTPPLASCEKGMSWKQSRTEKRPLVRLAAKRTAVRAWVSLIACKPDGVPFEKGTHVSLAQVNSNEIDFPGTATVG